MRAGKGRAVWLVFALVFSLAVPARADEPVTAREPRLLRETGENTTVIDAFDKDDPFDVNLSLGIRHTWKSANIRRETSLAQPGLSSGEFVAASENVAAYRQTSTTLDIGADVGLFRDLAASFRLPVILSDARELADLDGSSRNPQRFQDTAGQTLFSVPFRSPGRSGVDWLGVGLNYAIFNQQRDDTKPTWVIGGEARFAIGARMHACNDGAPVKCPDPANPTSARDPGISRGVNTYAIHTIASRRVGYVEPYVGFRLQVEDPQANSEFGPTSTLAGSILARPPTQATFTVGTEVFPWENREKFQRLAIDAKVRATYLSAGRDYSELFDALGSSPARTLRDPNPGAYRAGADGFTSVPDPTAPKVYFNGLTDQQAHGSFGGSVGATWQVGEYVKFHAGVGLTYVQNHLITSSDACNADLKTDVGASGSCRSGGTGAAASNVTGVPNPNHRPVIDLPGRRFSADDTTVVDLWLSSALMF